MFFFVDVDSMDKTRTVGQGVVSNERTGSDVFALESYYVEMSGGRHPEVHKATAILRVGQGPIQIESIEMVLRSAISAMDICLFTLSYQGCVAFHLMLFSL